MVVLVVALVVIGVVIVAVISNHGGGGGNISSILPTITTNNSNCNPKAVVHQRKAQEIIFKVQYSSYIPTTEEEEFVVCMIEQNEDKTEFKATVQKNRDLQRQTQEYEAEQRRQAEIEAHRPASPEEIQAHDQYCKYMAPNWKENQAAFLDECNKLWAANPHSRCVDLPCGNQCFDPTFYSCKEKSPGVLDVVPGCLLCAN
jgi:hypothetical protein